MDAKSDDNLAAAACLSRPSYQELKSSAANCCETCRLLPTFIGQQRLASGRRRGYTRIERFSYQRCLLHRSHADPEDSRVVATSASKSRGYQECVLRVPCQCSCLCFPGDLPVMARQVDRFSSHFSSHLISYHIISYLICDGKSETPVSQMAFCAFQAHQSPIKRSFIETSCSASRLGR
jgi:hypothetical protein